MFNSSRRTFKDVLNDQIALCHNNQKGDVSPCKQTELFHVVLLYQRQHEPNESDAVQAERQEAVISDEKSQRFNAVEQNAEIIKEILAVEEVIGSEQKVPGKTPEPWKSMNSVDLVAN